MRFKRPVWKISYVFTELYAYTTGVSNIYIDKPVLNARMIDDYTLEYERVSVA